MRRGAVRWVILAAAGTIVFGAKPELEHVYPTAVARGQTNTVNLNGKFEPWPPKAWASAPGLEFSFPTNKNTMEVRAAAGGTEKFRRAVRCFRTRRISIGI